MNLKPLRALCIAAALLIALTGCASAVELTSFRCSYYAAPTQDHGGEIAEAGAWGSPSSKTNSFEKPGTVSGFLENASPGETLCLRSGTYRGLLSMLAAPRGKGGAPGKPITVRALEDGEAHFDGEHLYRTVAITGSHWLLQGFNAYDSKGGIIGIEGRKTGAHDITVRRVVAWRNPVHTPWQNVMNVDVSFASDVLLEDVGCFGSARKCVQVHRSLRVTARRVWARWDGRSPHTGHNEFAFAPMYRSFDSLAENVLATSGGRDESGYTPPEYAPSLWLIGTDRGPEPDDVARFAPGRDRHDLRLRTLGSIAYSGPNQRFPSSGVLMTRSSMKGSVIRDVAVSVPAHSGRVMMLHDCIAKNGCEWLPGDTRNTATHLTLIGGPPGDDKKWKIGKWVTDDVQKFDTQQPVDIFTPNQGGATICHRTVDGQLTSEPLWPWPMNARILAATERSLWGAADVTAEIEELFGKIPAECKTPAAAR